MRRRTGRPSRVGIGAMLVLATAAPLEGQSASTMSALRAAAEAGDAAAQCRLGLAYRDGGAGVQPDLVRAHVWLTLAQTFGSADVQASCASVFLSVDDKMTPALKKESERRGLLEVQRLAADGRAWAQTFLGVAYHGGLSPLTPKDVTLGLQWLQKAAAQDEPRAQFMLGLIYQRGEGVSADVLRAMEWYRAAARSGHSIAQLMLGNGYFAGNGVLQDYAQAIYWWRLAADQGEADAQANLGDVYRLGNKGVAKDLLEAVRWYRLAVDHGHALAQWNLGVLLAEGRGAALDRVEAHKWMNLAAARAATEYRQSFAEGRDRLAQDMSPAQITEAQRRAREWLDHFEGRATLTAIGGLAPPPPPPPPPPPAPVRVGGEIKAPVKLRHVEPVYPPIAISARVQGMVLIEATISGEGLVVDAKILRSIPLLDGAALAAVREWQFAPTLLNGVPVPVIMTVTVSFTLTDRDV